jgi:hypothetical protein
VGVEGVLRIENRKGRDEGMKQDGMGRFPC